MKRKKNVYIHLQYDLITYYIYIHTYVEKVKAKQKKQFKVNHLSTLKKKKRVERLVGDVSTKWRANDGFEHKYLMYTT